MSYDFVNAPRRALAKIEIQGSTVWGGISSYNRDLTFTEVASGETDSLDIKLHDCDNHWLNDWLIDKGTRLLARIELENWDKQNEYRTIDCGEFICDSIKVTGYPIEVVIRSISIPINGTKNTKKWEKVSVSAIAQDICNHLGVGLEYYADSIVIKSQTQSQQTDIDFLFKVCQEYGFGMKEIIDKLCQMETVDIFGFNCGVGAAHLRKLLEKQTFPKECILSVLPNAGYQQELRGRMHYGDDPEYYAKQMERMIPLGINIAGGCCGTTPEHIAALKKVLGGQAPQPKEVVEENADGESVSNAAPTDFISKLERGEKVFVVELDAPFDAQMDKFSKGVYALKENGVDMITVSDSPLARSRADAALLAVYAKRLTDISVMPHVAMRDRNLIGLRSEILGVHANGIRDFLVITGDPVGPDNRGKITGVFDVNSIRFMEYLQHMNEEIFPDQPVYYGGALNYAGNNIRAIVGRMRKKMEAGCAYFLTQPIFSEEDVQRVIELKEMTGAKIICGLMPLVSYRNALFMKNEMPGIHVNDEILNRYDPEMSREEAEDTAVALCLDIAEALRGAADGFYLMTPFHRVGLVNRIINAIKQGE